MRGCLYYRNLRQYIEDEPALLEIWRMGDDGEIGAFFESRGTSRGLREGEALTKTKRIEMCGRYLEEGKRLWLEASTEEETIRIDAFWGGECGLLSGFCRNRHKASSHEVEQCFQMEKETEGNQA